MAKRQKRAARALRRKGMGGSIRPLVHRKGKLHGGKVVVKKPRKRKIAHQKATYDQGFDQGYDQGFMEGFAKAFKEGYRQQNMQG